MTGAPTGLLIGLTGHAGVGKDSVGDLLQSAGWHRTSFAQALRTEVAEHWRIDPRLLTERSTEETPMRALQAGMVHQADWLRWVAVQGHNLTTPRSPRWVLQHWASYRRCHRADHWVRHVLVELATLARHCPTACAVVTDVRYANEAQALLGRGGHIVRVHRPNGAPQLAADTAQHESERHTLIHAAADVHNDASFYELALEVRRVVHQLSPHQPQGATA